jgi:hypothetical protein
VSARLYLDEDVLPDVARLLRSRGVDAVSAHEVGATGLPDEAQLTRANVDGRVILSFNYRDFILLGEQWNATGHPHAGIVVSYRQYDRNSVGQLLDAIQSLLATVSAENLRNSVQVLDRFRP